MRALTWTTSATVTASACILGTLLLPNAASAHEYADDVPTVANVSPRAVSALDFIAGDDAVTVTANGFFPGEEVRIDIVSTSREIEAVHELKRARADGTVAISIGGSPGKPANAYAGEYQAKISSAQSMAEEFVRESFLVLPAVPAVGAESDLPAVDFAEAATPETRKQRDDGR